MCVTCASTMTASMSTSAIAVAAATVATSVRCWLRPSDTDEPNAQPEPLDERLRS